MDLDLDLVLGLPEILSEISENRQENLKKTESYMRKDRKNLFKILQPKALIKEKEMKIK